MIIGKCMGSAIFKLASPVVNPVSWSTAQSFSQLINAPYALDSNTELRK